MVAMRPPHVVVLYGTLGAMSDTEPELDINDPASWPYWMTIEEVAVVLRISPALASRLVLSGQIPSTSVTVGTQRNMRRIKRTDLLDLAPEAPEAQDPK